VEISSVVLIDNMEQSFFSLLPYAIIEEQEEEQCEKVVAQCYEELSNIKSILLFDQIEICFDIICVVDHKSALTMIDIHQMKHFKHDDFISVEFDTTKRANKL
jgi:hypothetical protein